MINIMDKRLFFILFLLQYVLDRFSSNCYSNFGEILLFFHHLYSLYLYTGSFFFNPKIHLIVSFLTLIHWFTYKKCIITEYSNKLCKIDTNRKFNDFYVECINILMVFSI